MIKNHSKLELKVKNILNENKIEKNKSDISQAAVKSEDRQTMVYIDKYNQESDRNVKIRYTNFKVKIDSQYQKQTEQAYGKYSKSKSYLQKKSE